MITRSQLETLVERVVSRLSEALPAPIPTKGTVPSSVTSAVDSNKNPKRYRADGTSTDEPVGNEPASATAKTQMPPTQPPPTIPAPKSAAEKEAAADGLGSSTITRNPIAAAPSQKTIKVNSIRKALDKSGFTGTPQGAKHTTQNLNAWYDQLDPADALVATADELAQRFANGE